MAVLNNSEGLKSSRLFKLALALSILLVAMVVAAVIFWDQLYGFFQDTESLKATVKSAGAWGPFVFIAVQFLQIIIAPIPGQAAGLIAGALFGPWLGTLYSVVGAALGFTTIFILAKMFGRPFVEKFVPKNELKRLDGITNKAGPFVLFLIFLLPGFPDDIICYLAGLSKIPIKVLVLVSIAGRLPGYLLTAFIGAGIGEANGRLVAILTAIVAVGALLAYWKRTQLKLWIEQLMDRESAAGKLDDK